MSKIVNISERAFRRALKDIIKEEEALNGPNADNFDPFGVGDEENHDEGIVGKPEDRTMYNPDDNIDIENP